MTKFASRLLGAALAVTALSGCAVSSAGVEATSVPASAVVDDGYLCMGVPVSLEALEERAPVSAIGEPGRTALADAVWDDGKPIHISPEEGWYVVSMTDEHVAVMRDVAVVTDDFFGPVPPDHEILAVSWVADATNVEPGWYVSKRSSCALTVDLGALDVPEIQLQTPVEPSTKELRLLVTEQNCNSGEDAQGRIEVISVEESDGRVAVLLGVRPRGGAHNCPSNPATPFTITLSEPVGTREVVNAGLADPRVLALAE